jgi:hypothetical protein
MYGCYSPEGMNQDKTHRALVSILLFHHRVFLILSKISDDDTSTETRQEGKVLKIRPDESMVHWTFSIKFPYDTPFIFGSLMFAAGEDGNLELLTQGPAPRHPAPVYGKTPYYPTDPSTSSGTCSDLNHYAWQYYLSTMTSQERPIRKTILQSSAGASSFSSSGAILIGIPSKIILRSGAVLVQTLPSKPATSAWWGQPGAILRTAPASTRP